MLGTVTLGAEVTNVSRHCFWLLLGDEELAVPFTDFPWFNKATIELWPVQVIFCWALHVRELLDRCLLEPREVGERHCQFFVPE